MAYALASSLVGFVSSQLRVKVLERRNGNVWVITADLLDSGTMLTLNDEQVVGCGDDYERKFPHPEYPQNAQAREAARMVCMAWVRFCVDKDISCAVCNAGQRLIESDPYHFEQVNLWKVLDLAGTEIAIAA